MTQALSPRELVDHLTALLRVEPVGADAFEGARAHPSAAGSKGRVFGGQVIAQALAAAEATVATDRPAHSLHAYFLRMGDEGLPIRFDVARDLDGGSFSNRRVIASQQADADARRPILSLTASFQRLEEGLSHQAPMPEVPGPEELLPDHERRALHPELFAPEYHALLFGPRPIDLRTAETPRWLDPTPAEPVTHCWLRTPAPVADDPRLHRAMLAYASDLALMPTAMIPHGMNGMRGGMHEASLDHAMWFHDDFRIDDWLLYQTKSGWSGRGRGFITGRVWRRDGTLVASISQEGMMRVARPKG